MSSSQDHDVDANGCGDAALDDTGDDDNSLTASVLYNTGDNNTAIYSASIDDAGNDDACDGDTFKKNFTIQQSTTQTLLRSVALKQHHN